MGLDLAIKFVWLITDFEINLMVKIIKKAGLRLLFHRNRKKKTSIIALFCPIQ